MSNGRDEHGNGTPRSSHLSSPTTATLSPTWRPPKSPLPPHRLAKLANALGVSTPIPASTSPTLYLSRSFSETGSSPIELRRSPTPSATASSMGFSSYPPSTSKFLLHVIPPIHLPHDSDNPDDSQIPPPPNTSGYHTQFRRGTLVPVHSTLQAQLGAIAKEYALPSATGLILYLVTSSPQSPSSSLPMDMDEPGPRLSEDIWKHLWTRVLRTEQRDDMLMASLSPRSATPATPRTPNIFGSASAARSTPFLPQESSGPLRPFLSMTEPPFPLAPQPIYPVTSPSTPSSISDIRSNNKSAPPSSSSVSQSEPDTPDTSIEDSGLRPNFLDLPGLNSPSLIPILAKVEFDIDRRKAAWYEPWIRSRKANHAKRTESRKGSRSQSQEGDGNDQHREHVPIEFLTGRKNKLDPFGLSPVEAEVKEEEEGYARLSESPEELGSDTDSETEEFVEDATAKFSSLPAGKDPLDDVFGTDADTWADIHSESGGPRKYSHPNVVDLALTAEELAVLPSPTHLEDADDRGSTKEEDEVLEMLDLMGKPHLAMAVPSPAKDSNKRSSSPTSVAGRKVPPPLVLKPKDKSGTTVIPSQPSPGTHLAYLGGPSDHEDVELDEQPRVRSPTLDSGKRAGAVFDDLDLGLDPTEDFDDDDPNDRRRSQIIMRAQLDEIERTMAQLSPRILKADLEEEQSFSFHSATLSPGSPAKLTLSPGGLRNSDFFPPPSPRLPRHPDPDPPENPMYFAGQTWPAVPFSSIKDKGSESSPNAPPSPPRLAVNGITTSAPRSYQPNTSAPPNGPSESERRKKLEEEEGGTLYPPVLHTRNESPTAESPIIPLSPDPFGRHPSSSDPAQSLHVSGAQWDTVTIGKGVQPTQSEIVDEPPVKQPVKGRARSGTTSRFSADSLNGEEPSAAKSQNSNRATLISVRTIRKLWRKSSNKSTSSSQPSVPPTPSATSSGRTSPMVPPQRPERPSQEQMYLPDIPDMPPANFGRVSPHQMAPPVPRMSLEQMLPMPPGRRPSVDQQMVPPPPANFGRLSPQQMALAPRTSQEQMPPMPPGRRPSVDQQIVPPPPANFGRVSPQHMAPLVPRMSQEQMPPMPPGRRPSVDQQMMPPPANFGRLSPQTIPSRADSMHSGHRPSLDQQNMMPPPRPSLDHLGAPTQPQHFQQLSIPSFPGRNSSPGPIITPHMQAARAASQLGGLHFDQESPYPTRPMPRQSPRPPSPPSLPAIPEQDKPVTRKSILKWKSAASVDHNAPDPSSESQSQSRSSSERSSSNGSSRGRRPSVINFGGHGSGRSSVTSPDLPPSPQIPTQYMNMNAKNGNGLEHRQSQRSQLTTSSTDSSYSPPHRNGSLQSQSSLGARSSPPPRSRASSRDSRDSHPSFDASQFEFVSPKAGTLSYPYNGLDHE